MDDKRGALDTSRLDKLRQLDFFSGFEEIELWEVLRISTWREVPAQSLLKREGDEESGFGIIIAATVEVSAKGRAICRLGAGEVVGEMAYLNQDAPRRCASVVTFTPLVYLDVNHAALALAGEECFQRFQKTGGDGPPASGLCRPAPGQTWSAGTQAGCRRRPRDRARPLASVTPARPRPEPQ